MGVNPIALSIPLFFAMIGVELAVARWQGLRVYRFDDAVVDLSCGISQQVSGLFTKVVPVGAYLAVYPLHLLPLDAAAPSTHLVAFLGVDLAYYWWHRFTHVTNLGWATHVVHHQSEDYNLAVALRQSITSSLSSWPFYLPLALLGVPPVVFFTHSALNTLYQFWIHTETVGRLGPLEWVLNTPSHHRVHHAINPRYIDKNYAGVLIVWDRLFGTFEPETETPVYGTVEPLHSFDPLWANLAFGVGMVHDALAARTWGDRLRVWFAHPGWRPVGLPPHPKPAPVRREDQRKYAPSWVSGVPGLTGYVVAQFVPVAAAVMGLLLVEDNDAVPRWALAVAAGLILWTVWIWGALFEARSAAVAHESARLGALAAAGLALALAGWPTLGGGLAAFALASGTWWGLRLRSRPRAAAT
jgi:sterol desaturase/sphingolipid hydroxylase (fatty acid hydroxylase superfamily)